MPYPTRNYKFIYKQTQCAVNITVSLILECEAILSKQINTVSNSKQQKKFATKMFIRIYPLIAMS